MVKLAASVVEARGLEGVERRGVEPKDECCVAQAGCVAFPESVVAVYASARRLQPISVAAMPQGAVYAAVKQVPVLCSRKRAEHASTCWVA